MNPNTIAESPPIDEKNARYEQVIDQLRRFMGGDMKYVNIWLNSPHPDLGGLTPQFFIDQGKIEVVESLAWAMEVGQPG